MKAVLHPVETLLKLRKKYGGELRLDMLDLAGQPVTIGSVEFHSSGTATVKLEEDKHDRSWRRWMFSSFPPLSKPYTLRLPEGIDGHTSATIHCTGNIKVGCRPVSFACVEALYLAATRARARLAKATAGATATVKKPKPKPRRKK